METTRPRLVKAIYVYDDGSTSERNWPLGRRPHFATVVARNESGSIREYSNHYQAFLRIGKGSRTSLANDEIFREAVKVLSRLLLLSV